VLPGAPRTPSSCALGRFQSPMQEMFWFPDRSICAAPIITCRLPAASMVNTLAYGSQPSMRSPESTRYASPSVSSKPGSNVSRASRAPRVGISPIGLARMAPSPRHASAQATTHTSARVAGIGSLFMP